MSIVCACIYWTSFSCLLLSIQSRLFWIAEGSSQQWLLSYVAMLILVLCYAPQVLCVLPCPNHEGKPGQQSKHVSAKLH